MNIWPTAARSLGSWRSGLSRSPPPPRWPDPSMPTTRSDRTPSWCSRASRSADGARSRATPSSSTATPTIAGDVTDNVIAFNGDVTITGHVGENVFALNGRVTSPDGAHVGGDVVSRFRPIDRPAHGRRPAPAAQHLQRELRTVHRGQPDPRLARHVHLVVPARVAAHPFVPRAADAPRGRRRSRLGASIGFGLLLLIGLPIVAFIAMGDPARDPARARSAPCARAPLLARVHGRRLRARPAPGRRPAHRLLAFLAGWGDPAGSGADPGGRRPRLAGRDRLGPRARSSIAARAAGRAEAEAAPVGHARGGAPPIPPVPPPPPIAWPDDP